jgi:hypothetical protein
MKICTRLKSKRAGERGREKGRQSKRINSVISLMDVEASKIRNLQGGIRRVEYLEFSAVNNFTIFRLKSWKHVRYNY